jgi:hypothetical protein
MLIRFIIFAGELPKELGNLVNLKELELTGNGFGGEKLLTVPSIYVVTEFLHFFAGEVPKELGKLVNLETFNVMGNSIGGEL